MKFYSLLLLGLFFTFCKSSQKQSQETSKVESAVWYNWTGGMPGVGGTNFEITLKSGEQSEIKKLVIEETEVEISDKSFTEGIWKITAVENRSNTDETINPRNRKVDYRTEAPKSAKIIFLENGKEKALEITDFTKGDSKNYQ